MKFSKSIQLTSNARRCALTTVSIVALLGCASAALADEAAAGSDLEEVVVTGSRIARDGFDTPTPVNVLGAQEIAASAPANIADFVNTLPSVAGSITAAILLTFISAALASYPEWRMVIYSLLLIVLMIYRPQGLFGNKELSLKAFSRLGGGGQHGAAKNR